MLVEDPPAAQDPAGVNLPPVELLQNGVTVVARFKHLTVKVPFNVELDLVRISSGLGEDVGKRESGGREGLERCGANMDEKRESLLRDG